MVLLEPSLATISMRTTLYVCSLLLCVCGSAYAQISTPPGGEALPPKALTTTPPNKDTPEHIKERGRAWFQKCMQDWDTATHMTKVEWERTCRRVAAERTRFLIEHSK